MERKAFIQSLLGMAALSTLGSFERLIKELPGMDVKMPVLFIGHGSPMNAIEDNEFTEGWRTIGEQLPKPKAILMISAHWETRGTFVTAMDKPKTIHDFGGFPPALFEVKYPANGSRILAEETKRIITSTTVGLDESWGLDHGAWSVLNQLFPLADVPVIQLSLDRTEGAAYHYNLAKQLSSLRNKGVLIIGSGNMVHNFQYARFSGNFSEHFGHDWAIEANETFKTLIMDRQDDALINYQKYSRALQLSAPTPDHYWPLLYTLGLREKNEETLLFNDAVVGGSFSMTSVKIG